jgi:hypothetical protein
MDIHAVHDVAIGLIQTHHWLDSLQQLHWYLPADLLVLDKQIESDLFGDVQRAVNHFIKSGQAWAFLIGLFFGYFIKTFTSFG